MAWLDVHIVEDSGLQETIDTDGSVRATVPVVYYVEADAPVSQDQMLLASFGGVTVPTLGREYSATRPNCRCRRRAIDRKGAMQALITCTFEDPTDGSATATLPSKPARIRSGSESYAQGYHVDAEGNPCVNAAGEAFEQPPERMEGVKVYTIRKYVTAATKAILEAAWNTNNDEQVTIDGTQWAADEAWLYSTAYESVDGSSVEDATIVIKCKPGGWFDLIPNVGFRERDGRKIKIRDTGAGMVIDYVNGEEPDKPWPLTEDGIAFGPSVAADSLIELQRWPYPRHDWTGVPLS